MFNVVISLSILLTLVVRDVIAVVDELLLEFFNAVISAERESNCV